MDISKKVFCNIFFLQNIAGLLLQSFSSRARQYSPENFHRSGARLNSLWLFVAASATRNAASSAGVASREEASVVVAGTAPSAAAAAAAAR